MSRNYSAYKSTNKKNEEIAEQKQTKANKTRIIVAIILVVCVIVAYIPSLTFS